MGAALGVDRDAHLVQHTDQTCLHDAGDDTVQIPCHILSEFLRGHCTSFIPCCVDRVPNRHCIESLKGSDVNAPRSLGRDRVWLCSYSPLPCRHPHLTQWDFGLKLRIQHLVML